MRIYADEDFALPVVQALSQLGHDVVTAQHDGRSGCDDSAILARGHALARVLLTYNRRHFERLHRAGQAHSGIVTCTHDNDFSALAARIDHALKPLAPGMWCLRVNRPP